MKRKKLGLLVAAFIILCIVGQITSRQVQADNSDNDTYVFSHGYLDFSENKGRVSEMDVVLSKDNPFIYKYGSKVYKYTEGTLEQVYVKLDNDFAKGKRLTLLQVPVPKGYRLAYSGTPVIKYGNPGYEDEYDIYNKSVDGSIPVVKIGEKISINYVFVHVDCLGNFTNVNNGFGDKYYYKYNGKSTKEKIMVTANSIPLLEGSDYELSYSKPSSEIYTENGKNYRAIKVTITGKGIYKDSRTITYYVSGIPNQTKVTVPKINLSNVVGKRAGVTVKWTKKSANIKGYQIQIASDKNFKKIVKKQTVSNKKISSKTIKGLKSKKKYWVRIRGYYVKNHKTSTGKWSKVRSVKVK